MATAIVGLEQVGQRARVSNHRRLQLGRNPGEWFRLGKLYEPLGIQYPARWSRVSNVDFWQKPMRLAKMLHHTCIFRLGVRTRSVLTPACPNKDQRRPC